MCDIQGCDEDPKYYDDWGNRVCESCMENELENNPEARESDYEEI